MFLPNTKQRVNVSGHPGAAGEDRGEHEAGPQHQPLSTVEEFPVSGQSHRQQRSWV